MDHPRSENGLWTPFHKRILPPLEPTSEKASKSLKTGSRAGSTNARFSSKERWNFVARVIISTIALGSGLYVILVGTYPDATIKWAFGIVGLVIGYWLR